MLPANRTIDQFVHASEKIQSWIFELDNARTQRVSTGQLDFDRLQLVTAINELFSELLNIEDVLEDFSSILAATVGSVSEYGKTDNGEIIGDTYHQVGFIVCYNIALGIKDFLCQVDDTRTINDLTDSELAEAISSACSVMNEDCFTSLPRIIFREQKKFLFQVGYELSPASLLSAREIGGLFSPPVPYDTIKSRTQDWGSPTVKGSGNKPNKWRVGDVAKIVQDQYPDRKFPAFLTR